MRHATLDHYLLLGRVARVARVLRVRADLVVATFDSYS